AAEPNQPSILNLRGEILLEQQKFEDAEMFFKKALKVDSKFREAQFNLADVPFRKKEYAKARDRFESLLRQTPGGDKNQASQLIKFKIFMTYLLEGKDSRAQKMMEQFQFSGDTPALYYAQAAYEFQHSSPSRRPLLLRPSRESRRPPRVLRVNRAPAKRRRLQLSRLVVAPRDWRERPAALPDLKMFPLRRSGVLLPLKVHRPYQA